MKFTISLEPTVAEEGFLSKLKDAFKKKSTTKKSSESRPSFNSINDAIDGFAEYSGKLYQFTLPSCSYGNDCVWNFYSGNQIQVDDTLRRKLTQVYQTANGALPKIQELIAKQYYDNSSRISDEDDQLITEDQKREYSRDQFKREIEILSVDIDIDSPTSIEVDYEIWSKVAKNEDIYLKIVEVPNGMLKASDTVDLHY